MNRKKITIIIILLALIAVVVVACQSSGEKETAEPTKNEAVSESTAAYVKADDKTSSTDKNKTSDKNDSSSSGSSSSSDKKNDSSSSSSIKPTTHTHSWTAVYATKQVQVGTENKCVGSILCCVCGARDINNEHTYKHMDNNEPNNTWREYIYDDVPVYETQKYIDYYKCSCGATK